MGGGVGHDDWGVSVTMTDNKITLIILIIKLTTNYNYLLKNNYRDTR